MYTRIDRNEKLNFGSFVVVVVTSSCRSSNGSTSLVGRIADDDDDDDRDKVWSDTRAEKVDLSQR